MIDLAPNNPYGLTLASPVLTAAGCFGYGVEYTRLATGAASLAHHAWSRRQPGCWQSARGPTPVLIA
jgi:hypothetical protein